MNIKNDIKINLIDILAEFITSKVNSKLNKEGLELEKLKLGFQILLINISKAIIIIAIASVLNTIKETLFMIVVFGCIRKKSFGVHAKSSLVCTLTCIVIFDFGAYFSQYLKLNNYIIIISFIIINILLYKYAPADTEYHPLLGNKLRSRLKKESVITGILLMVIALIIPNNKIKTLITLSSSFAVTMILPIIYKILKRRYNNYEQYEREDVF